MAPPQAMPPQQPMGPDDQTPMYAQGGMLKSQPILANPVPMARQMARYRSQGGPMSKIENPMTAASFPSGMAKASGKKFPMPKSEHGSMTGTAFK